MGNKALTAALHRPRVRRAQLDKVGQCGEKAQAGGPFQQPHPQHPQGSHTRESLLGLKGPLRVGRKRSPLEPWLFPGLPFIENLHPCGFCKAVLLHQRSLIFLSCLSPPPAPGLTSFLCCPDSQPTRFFLTVCALVFQGVRKNTTLLSDRGHRLHFPPWILRTAQTLMGGRQVDRITGSASDRDGMGPALLH